MKPIHFKAVAAGLALALSLSAPAWSMLAQGAAAPDFSVQATLGGQVYPFKLADALKKGPVVLYFFPAAFTSGCTVEAHEFAAAIDDFKTAGASVIGMTAGNVDRLAEFSVSECRSKFPVAAATSALIASYDSRMAVMPNLSNRTSYVIAPDGKILLAFTGQNPVEHVQKTLAAVRAWRTAHPAR